MALGGESQLVGVVAGAGGVGSSGSVVDRGGRAVVEDADDDSGHQLLRQVRQQVPGALDWKMGVYWVAGLILERGIGPRLSGGEELVTGDSRPPGS